MTKKINRVVSKETRQGYFDKTMPILKMKIQSQIMMSERIDAAVQIREEYKSYFDATPSVNQLKMYTKRMTELYKIIEEEIGKLTCEMLGADDFEEPLSKLIGKLEDCTDDKDIFDKFMEYMYIRPWGEMILSLRNDILNIEE